MNVYLFGFAKKKNSTAQPALNSGTRFSCQLKDETGVMNPVLLLNDASNGMPNPFTPSYFTYAYIDKFERYYYVTDWQYVNGLWNVFLSVDVLASFKTAIGNLSEYVVRSSASFDTSVADIMYPTATDYAVSKSTIDLNLDMTGFYILGIISNSSAVSEGAISYYIMTAAQMANFKSYLMSETFLSDNGLASLQDMNKELIKCVYNPYQYIVSCKFFPFAYPSNTGTAVSSINFGWWSVQQSARLISGYNIFTLQSDSFTASAHPQAARGRYLNHAPYTEMYVMHPLIGTVLLDTNKIEATNTVKITMTADAISGQGVIDITNTTRGLRLYESVLQFAQDIPLAQMSQDVIGMGRTAINSAGNLVNSVIHGAAMGAAGGAVGAIAGGVIGAIAGGATGVLNTLEASIPILQSSGVNGNKANYYFPADFYTVYRKVVDEDRAHRGRPLCQVKTINTLSGNGGYILCADAHAEFSCYDTERDMIVSYLNTGFYYE